MEKATGNKIAHPHLKHLVPQTASARPGSVEDCFDEHQWWHYQIMADNMKAHAGASKLQTIPEEEKSAGQS